MNAPKSYPIGFTEVEITLLVKQFRDHPPGLSGQDLQTSQRIWKKAIKTLRYIIAEQDKAKVGVDLE